MSTMPSKFERGDRPQRKTRGNIVIAFEGYKTEPRYFKHLEESRFFPNSELSLVPLWRDLSKINDSNPVKVLQFLKENQEWIESEDDICPVNLFLRKYLHTVAWKFKKGLYDKLYPHLEQNGNRLKLKFPVFENYMENLLQILDAKGLVDADGKVKISKSLAPINEFMKTVFPEYDFSEEIKPYSFKKPCNFDENYYVMLVDRDQKTFGKKIVEEVRSDCSKHGYKLILTSPYFELWLTLHFEKYEKEKLLEFVKEEVQLIYEQGIPRSDIGRSLGPKRYMELLKPGYTKNGTFEWVKRSDIDRALANSEDLCTNLDMLVQELHSNDLSSVGTNIKELFDLLKE